MTTYRQSEASPPPRYQREVFSTGFDIPRAGGVVAQPITRDYPPSPVQTKVEYVVRPRTHSLGYELGYERRANDPPRSPLTERYYRPDGSGSYIVPAVSSPRRQVTTDSAHGPHVQKDRRHPNGYRLVQYDGEDYSYTNPHDQFNEDYPPRGHSSRPTGTSDMANRKATSRSKELGPPPAVRQFRIGGEGSRRVGNSSDTEAKPKRRHSMRTPVSLHQHPEEMHSSRRYKGPAGEMYSSHREKGHAGFAPRDQSRPDDIEPNYTSDIEYDRPSSHGGYHRHPRRFPEESRDRSGKFHAIAAAGLGGLGAAGLTSAIVRKTRDKDDTDREDPHEFQDRQVRSRDHKSADAGRARGRTAELREELREEDVARRHHGEKVKKERSDSDSIDSHTEGRRHGSKHHHHHRRHRRRHHKPQELGSEYAINDRTEGEGPEEVDRDWHERGSAQEGSHPPHRVRRHPHNHKRRSSEDGVYTGPPTDGEEGDDSEESEESEKGEDDEEGEEGDDRGDRTTRLQLVEPPKEKKEPEVKPKGILKPPREEPFPEYPNPEREGVAPLKEKKGIPPGARWTKIKRVLVNPEALEEHHERYEDRGDYVIVLRVLSKEEIQVLANTTHQIRGEGGQQFLSG